MQPLREKSLFGPTCGCSVVAVGLDRDFWSEIKRIRAKTVGVSRNVHGVPDNVGISKLFCDKYQKLYSCVSYNERDIRCIKNEISSKIASENCSEVYQFTISDIKTAIRRLKPHKSDDASGLSSDYVINADDVCYVHFALLFNAIVVHGNLLDNFLV